MIRLLICFLARAIVSLRYRVEVKGLEKLTPERLNKKGGILLLPNHPAHLDPLLVFLFFWPRYRMRPLVVEYIYKLPFLRPFHRLISSIPIPDFDSGVNELKIKKGEKAVQEIAEGLKRKDNFVVYPSGRLKGSGKELLGGASGSHELWKECPEANVVLVRTTGLWGSSFSRALTGTSPNLLETAVNGLKVLLKNFLLFAPRRKVLIEVEPNPADFPAASASRIEFNRYLENWYNRYPDKEGNISESEPLTLVSYSFWRQDLPKVVVSKRRERGVNGDRFSEETEQKVYREIRRILENPNLEIRPEQNLAFDLGMDSLNIAEFIAYLTKSFDIGDLHPEDLETVGTILEIAEGGQALRPKIRPKLDLTWPEEKGRPIPMPPLGRTLQEAFLNVCERLKGYAACGDDVAGVLSSRKLKKAVLVLSQYFRTWKEPRVAVMLPASAAAFIVVLALEFAGKIPVMLNWTLGPRYLEEMMKISGASRIVTSARFLDRLQGVQFGAVLDQLVMLEDIRASLSLRMKLRGLFLSKCSISYVLQALGLSKIDENQPCVILFTSGTEATPKGVPLSHKNIIFNLRGGMQCIKFSAEDVIQSILPPFHSFGFSVVGLFPLLSGFRVVFYPDPTDSFALAEGVERWRATLFCSPPSFLKGLLRTAKKEQLKTVRMFISGAEKAPPELFDRVDQIGSLGRLVEGYGITECSPIISMNRPTLPPKGAGWILPDMEAVTIHPETEELLPEGADGEICVRGPNVFSGYLGNPRTPFIEIQGKQWYRTGDLGHIEPDGALFLSGRLKRFTKLGGEMISLGALEEVLMKTLLASGRINPDIPSIAVIAFEKEIGKPQLILFTTISIEKEEINRILQQAGFSNLIKISGVKKIDEIPLMGAGKTNYRALQALCN